MISLIAVLFLICSSCEEEATLKPKTYPLLLTLPVSELDSTGVTLNARIDAASNTPIEDYGFLLWNGQDSIQFSLIDSVEPNEFQMRISIDLINNRTYLARGYIKTPQNLILANTVTFVSKGSALPVIKDFSPKKGIDSTKITLTGNYFSHNPENIEVFLRDVRCNLLEANPDTLIFVTPLMEYSGDAEIKIRVHSEMVTAQIPFRIIGPEINTIDPLSGRGGTYVTITGNNFKAHDELVEVYFADHKAHIIDQSNEELFVVTPPVSFFEKQNLPVRIKNDLKSAEYNSLFLVNETWEELTPPMFRWLADYKAFSYNNKGYFLANDSKKLHEYNPDTDSWQVIEENLFPGQRNDFSLYIVQQDKFYKFGGMIFPEVPSNEIWSYSFLTSEWYREPDLPFSFINATYFEEDGIFFLITDKGECWKCDFARNEYVQLNDFPIEFEHGFASTFKVDEENFAVTYGQTWKYNRAKDSWQFLSENPFTYQSNKITAMGFTHKNTGYVVYSNNDLYKYDSDNDRWLLISKFPAGTYLHDKHKTTFKANNQTYMALSWGLIRLKD